MITRYPFDTVCQVFAEGKPSMNGLSPLDVRLGIEALVADPAVRQGITNHWISDTEVHIDVESPAYAAFIAISPRHIEPSALDVQNGLDAILDDEDFKEVTLARWERADAEPPVTETVDIGGNQ